MLGELTVDEKITILKRRLDRQNINLSEVVGIGQQTISNWCCGRARPSPKYKEKLIEIGMGLIDEHDFVTVTEPTVATDAKNKRGRVSKPKIAAEPAPVALPAFNGFGEKPIAPVKAELPPPPVFPNFF